jgi:hypothetical protein
MFVASATRLLIDKGLVIPYKTLLCQALSGRNSAVECQLPKLDVTGSIPVARSKPFTIQTVPERKSTVFLTGKSKVSLDELNFLNCLTLLNGLSFLMESGNIRRNKVSKNQFESNKKRS